MLPCQHFCKHTNRHCHRPVLVTNKLSSYCLFHQDEPVQNMTFCTACRTWVRSATFRAHSGKKCPVLKRQMVLRSQPFYDENCNGHNDCVPGFVPVSVRADDLESRILSFSKQYGIQPLDITASDQAISPAMKHSLQHDAIIARISRIKGMNEGIAVVELGAGKADLSEAIILKFQNDFKERVGVVAVDMCSFRHAADCRLRRLSEFTRATIDIRHFRLDKVDIINRRESCICVSKHLCGSGFDYALRCIVNSEKRVNAVAMAPCCHQKCTWGALVGRKYLENLGFDSHDFESMCRFSSWATLLSEQCSTPQQFIIGKTCKYLINRCRMEYLKESGFINAALTEYIDSSVTPENVLLEATRNP